MGRYKKSATFTFSKKPTWTVCNSLDNTSVRVSQLLAISEGADPEKVFSGGEYHVHHKNGVPWDNRPENLELLTRHDHMKVHTKYTKDELLSWIQAFKEEFGVVPRATDAASWPGPSQTTYCHRFGSWQNAVRKAGFKPPNPKD